MTYTEWRDELKSNLLSVSESERRRVLDYYAEAYADRREAGFSEREIIQDFGAPYDAAQRILSENRNDNYYEGVNTGPAEQPRREAMREDRRKENYSYAPPPPPPPPQPQPAYAGYAPAARKSNDYTWVFVLLCIIFAFPLFGLIMTMVGITIGLCVAPVAVVGSGVAVIAAYFGMVIGGEIAAGFFGIGIGVIILGLGIILCPLFFKLVGLMWKLFNMVFTWLKSLFSGKERR